MSSADFNTKGTFADVVLPALLVRAMNARFTGMFRAERESIIKVIYFKEGDIAFASSNQPSDRLGEVLIKRGQLTREQLDMAMSKLEANVSLGRMLVELGYLSPKELLAGAKAQVEEILYSLNTWREGNYEFVEGPLAPRIVDLKLSMRQVVLQAIMQIEDRAWVLKQIGSMESVFAANPDLSEALQGMKVAPETQQIADMIDGTNTVRDLCARSALDEFTVTKAVTAFHLLNLTHITEREGDHHEYMAPFGQAKGEEATTLVGGGSASETVPGFASFSEAEAEAEASDDDEFGHTTDNLPVSEVVAPSSAASPSGDEELTYEEDETWDDAELEDEGDGKPWLKPLIGGVVLLALLGGGWFFRDSLPFVGGGQETPTPIAALATTPSPSPESSLIPLPTPDSAGPGAAPATGTPASGTLPETTSTAPPPPPGITPPIAVVPTPPALPTPAATMASSGPPPPPPSRTPTTVALPTPPSIQPPPLPTPATTRVAQATPPRMPAVPVATPPRSSPPPRATAAAIDTGATSASLDAGDYGSAGRGFRQALAGRNGYSLQLEIVCQATSVKEGWGHASGSSEYMIIPFTYRERPCYRVLWGVYGSRSEAERAAASVPGFFRTQLAGRAVPVVRLSAVR